MDNIKTNYSDICYKNNFLTEVIARVDLLSPITKIEKSLPKKISDTVKSKFPIAEPRKMVAQELQISSNGFKEPKLTEMIEWRFYDKKRDKILTIHPQFLWIACHKYSSYEQLKEDFFEILSVFFKEFNEAQGLRAGLRYVNAINLKEDNPLSWENYINEDMLCLIQSPRLQKNASRIISTLEYNFDDFNFKFKFGIQNPDYPALIKQKQFILDLDAFYHGIQDGKDITSNFDKFHDKIQNFFELSIGKKLRDILNGT